MKPMTFEERAKLGMEMISKQKPLTFDEMKASVERVHAGALQSVKESIENAKMDPKTNIDELVKEQAEIVKVFPDVITIGIPVIRLSSNKWRVGTWYGVAQPNQQESTIYPKHPFYFKREPYWGIGMVIIQLSGDILGGDETLLIRYENRGEGSYTDMLLAISKKLSDLGYDSVVFYETEPLQLKEVYSISIDQSDAAK